MKKIIVILAVVGILGSCSKGVLDKLEAGYLGAQKANTEEQFMFYLRLYKDNSAIIMSGNPRYVDGAYLKGYHDEEALVWSSTSEGFVLSDPDSGAILYSAVSTDEYWKGDTPFPNSVNITWSHSAGVAWDTYSEKYGWQQSMTIYLQGPLCTTK